MEREIPHLNVIISTVDVHVWPHFLPAVSPSSDPSVFSTISLIKFKFNINTYIHSLFPFTIIIGSLTVLSSSWTCVGFTSIPLRIIRDYHLFSAAKHFFSHFSSLFMYQLNERGFCVFFFPSNEFHFMRIL